MLNAEAAKYWIASIRKWLCFRRNTFFWRIVFGLSYVKCKHKDARTKADYKLDVTAQLLRKQYRANLIYSGLWWHTSFDDLKWQKLLDWRNSQLQSRSTSHQILLACDQEFVCKSNQRIRFNINALPIWRRDYFMHFSHLHIGPLNLPYSFQDQLF